MTKKLVDAEVRRLKVQLQTIIAIRLGKWSQAEAARQLGVGKPRISDLIRGKVDRFSIDTLIAICLELGVQVEIRTSVPTPGEKP